jgi:hypothetical protein
VLNCVYKLNKNFSYQESSAAHFWCNPSHTCSSHWCSSRWAPCTASRRRSRSPRVVAPPQHRQKLANNRAIITRGWIFLLPSFAKFTLCFVLILTSDETRQPNYQCTDRGDGPHLCREEMGFACKCGSHTIPERDESKLSHKNRLGFKSNVWLANYFSLCFCFIMSNLWHYLA